MGHYATVWNQKEATEIIKDWNGIDQVLLRNPHGASAKVLTFFSTFMSQIFELFSQSAFSRLVYMEDK